jgi:amidase
MERRDFIRNSALALTAAVASRGASGDESPATRAMEKAIAVGDARGPLMPEWSVADLQERMQSGKDTARLIVESYLERIEAIDKSGPAIHAVIEVNPDALTIADALDRERKEKGPRGPLHGIPVLIKDNIDTDDKMMTTAGSLAMVGAKPARDAHIVKLLREAGAIVLGKTNLSEWANFRSTRSTSGWSGRGGQTKNPYALDRNPCGSSSGSGAAAAANLCTVAVGTETDGSIVCPSSTNSLVGIKPTLGLVSRSGIIPIAHSQDTAGPMARTVADAAALLSVLAGHDERDAVTVQIPPGTPADYTKFLDKDGLRGARLGILRKNFGFHDQVDALLKGAIEEMKKRGAVIVDPAEIPTAGQFDESELEVLLYEFKTDLNLYLAALQPGAPVRTLKDVIDFNEKNRDKEMPFFGQELFLRAEAKGPLTDKPYLKALRKNQQLAREKGINFALKKDSLDALVAPTGGPAWPTDCVNGDHFTGGYSSASAVAGYPHITVPAGYVRGLPIGISFFAGPWSESKLVKLAYAFEQATKVRVAPRFLPTAELG